MGHAYRDGAFYQEMCEFSDKLLTNDEFLGYPLYSMFENMTRQLTRSLLLGTH